MDICILSGNYKFEIHEILHVNCTYDMPRARATLAHYSFSALSNGQSFAQRLGNSCRTLVRITPFSGFSKVAHERLSRD